MGQKIRYNRATNQERKDIPMNDDRDLLIFTDEEGQEITLEVLDYFEYDGEEYALLADADQCAHDHEHGDECGCDEEVELIIMKVVTDGDTEEFVPVDEDKLEEIVTFLQEDGADLDYDVEFEDDEE